MVYPELCSSQAMGHVRASFNSIPVCDDNDLGQASHIHRPFGGTSIDFTGKLFKHSTLSPACYSCEWPNAQIHVYVQRTSFTRVSVLGGPSIGFADRVSVAPDRLLSFSC